MSNNMDELFANVKKMVDSGNIPDDVKQMMNNLQNSSNTQNNVQSNTPDLNNILNNISPEMINNLSNILNSNPQNQCNTHHESYSIDISKYYNAHAVHQQSF